ncbi:hypothetical protein VTK26DRAFT_3820 [Humicola hyalothermophila]
MIDTWEEGSGCRLRKTAESRYEWNILPSQTSNRRPNARSVRSLYDHRTHTIQSLTINPNTVARKAHKVAIPSSIQVRAPHHDVALVDGGRVAVLFGKLPVIVLEHAPPLGRVRPVGRALRRQDTDQPHADLVADQVVARRRWVQVVVPVLFPVLRG